MGLLRNFFLGPPLKREIATTPAWPEPLPGTNSSMWPGVWWFWQETYGGVGGLAVTPSVAERVWVANRCIQLNSQQIAGMPLEFVGTYEPAWVSNPDPNWFPNGIGDAIFAVVRYLYGWGFACLYVTSRYANGLPQTWTVLDSSTVTIDLEGGRRTYRVHDRELDADDVVQIDRNPGHALHGTSALQAYATQAWGLLAAADLGYSIMQGGVPQAVLKARRPITAEQAALIQSQWVARTSERGGAPPVLGEDLDFEALSLSPADLLLIEGQEFNARVIASAYGVPPFLLNMPLEGGLTYQNPEKLGEFWWRFELRPTAKRVADALTAQMLPRGNFVTFDAADTFLPLDELSEEDDPQLSQVADASPADQNGTPPIAEIRPLEVRA